MAQFLYTVDHLSKVSAKPINNCPAMHCHDDDTYKLLGDSTVTEPDAAKLYMETHVLPRYPGATVKLYLMCEEWVPTTHKRNKR